MKIGGHAVLFTGRIATDTEEVLKGFAESGCEGVEIGARFFGVEKSGYLKELLDRHGLALSGLHLSVQWTDLLDQPEKVEEALGKAVGFLEAMDEKNIILTAMAVENPSENPEAQKDARLSQPKTARRMVAFLNKLAGQLKEGGVQVHYHNHYWEFEDGGLLFETLLEYGPDIQLALDTGWAASMGCQPAKLLISHPGRFSYLHLRDFKKADMEGRHTFAQKQEGYVDLGKGDMDYQALIKAAKGCLGQDGWAVVEYEKGKVDFNRYAEAVAYVRRLVQAPPS